MRISEAMIRYYLDTVTVGYFNDHELPPDDVHGYAEQVHSMGLKMAKHGDSQALRLGLAYLLRHGEIDLSYYNGGRYPFDDAEMREIIRYIESVLFPEKQEPTDDELGRVEIIAVPLEEWWKTRSKYGEAM